MTQSPQQDFTHLLQPLMQRVGISSFKALSRQAGVSERQLKRLRQGQLRQMPLETLLKLSAVLNVPLSELLATFGGIEMGSEADSPTGEEQSFASLQLEYQRLQTQLEQQRQTLMQEFQQGSLQVMESWLLQWPSAAYAAQQNPQLPAANILRLVRPIEQLLQQWGVDAIAAVGEELPYDPQVHQLMEGTAQPGDRVRVRYIGYRQRDKLLYRARVSPVGNPHKA